MKITSCEISFEQKLVQVVSSLVSHAHCLCIKELVHKLSWKQFKLFISCELFANVNVWCKELKDKVTKELVEDSF